MSKGKIITTNLNVRFRDLDALGHVNNAVFFTYFEQGRIHLVGEFPFLEEELCTWIPGVSRESPNRLDAMVWAITELMLGEPEPEEAIIIYDSMQAVRELELR